MRLDGKKMKLIREGKGVKTEEVALAADLSARRIQDIEQGERTNVNLNVAKAVAKRLGVKLEDIAREA